jgi:hypothetical protein
MAAGGYVRHNIWGEPRYLGYPLTPWYPPDVKPVRKGLYIVGSDELSAMMYWNGEYWLSGNGQKGYGYGFGLVCWRGINGEPRSD